MVCDHCCRLCAAAFDFAKRIYVDPVCCGCGGHDGLAYHIVPDETDDLYRYYGMLDILREQGKAGLDYIVNLNWYNWKTYITFRYYFYFLSFFPNNRYLAAVTMFIVYALMFLVMYKAAQRYQVSKGYVLLGTLFFLSTYWFYDTASGIRNGLAFAIVIACAYYHWQKSAISSCACLVMWRRVCSILHRFCRWRWCC